MKKRLLFLTVLVMVMCLFALSVSADSVNPSTSDAYGTPTTFDEAIGRTDISQNKADGMVAYTVLYDGTSDYYTVPTTYLLSKNQYESGGILLQFDFSAISTKLNKSFSRTSVIRCELPDAITLIGPNNDNYPQCFQGFSNVVEIKLSSSISFVSNYQHKAFANCKNLVEIDLSNVSFNYPNSTYSLLEYCENLKKVTLPDAYEKDGAPVDYAINYMFNGCKKLETIENYNNFFRGVTIVGQKAFMDCQALCNIELWDGLETIERESFINCMSLTSIVIPDTVTKIGTTGTTKDTAFASCTALKKVVLPSGPVSIGNFCFEKCTALTDVWMPGAGSTFAGQVFGQCGSSLAVNFYFTTATSTITISDTTNNGDPFITAISATSDARIKYNTPLSTKCAVFLDGHHASPSTNDCTNAIACKDCATILVEAQDGHDIVVTIVYDDGFASVGVKTTDCTREGCTVCDKTEEAPAIFTAKGYSYKEEGNGISGGFEVDTDAFKAFKDANPDKAVTVSLLIVNPEYLDTSASFFDANGLAVASNGVLQVKITEVTYAKLDYMVSGFSLEYMQNLELAFAIVVKTDDKIEVIQKQYGEGEASVASATYTDKNGIKLDAVTVASIAPDVVEALKKEQEQLA